MDQDIKAKWLKRLRDPKTKQTCNVLHDENGYCCLGVLCALAVEADIIKEFPNDDRTEIVKYGSDSITAIDTYLPEPVLEWAGLLHRNPKVRPGEDGHDTLAEMNDSGKTFAEIAAVIEAQL